MADKIQIRRDTAANWTSANPVLAQGELALETDTSKLKAGDGTTVWSSLAYYTLGVSGVPAASITGTLSQSQLANEAVNEAKMQVSNAPTNGYMLTAQSGDTGGLTWAAAPTSSTTYGDVGTYIMGRRVHSSSNQAEFLPGSTYAGSVLFPGGISAASGNVAGYWSASIHSGALNAEANALSGTWRAMGETDYVDTFNPLTLFVRIS